MTNEEFNEFLNDHELNSQSFADIIGVTKGAVRHWIFARREIPETVVRLIKLFKAEPDDMEYFKELGDQ